MIHDRLPWPISDDRYPLDQHHPACMCDDCVPYLHEPDLVEEASRTAGLALLGLLAGIVVTWLIDLAIGGPGLGVMVGL